MLYFCNTPIRFPLNQFYGKSQKEKQEEKIENTLFTACDKSAARDARERSGDHCLDSHAYDAALMHSGERGGAFLCERPP